MNSVSPLVAYCLLGLALLLPFGLCAAPAEPAAWTVPCKISTVTGPATRPTVEALTTADLTMGGVCLLPKGTHLKVGGLSLPVTGASDWSAESSAPKAGAAPALMRLRASLRTVVPTSTRTAALKSGQTCELLIEGITAMPASTSDPLPVVPSAPMPDPAQTNIAPPRQAPAAATSAGPKSAPPKP